MDRPKRKKQLPAKLLESDMEFSDEGEENITFIAPKPKIAKIQNKLATKKPVHEGKMFLNSIKGTEVDSSKDTKIELNLVPSSDNNPER